MFVPIYLKYNKYSLLPSKWNVNLKIGSKFWIIQYVPYIEWLLKLPNFKTSLQKAQKCEIETFFFQVTTWIYILWWRQNGNWVGNGNWAGNGNDNRLEPICMYACINTMRYKIFMKEGGGGLSNLNSQYIPLNNNNISIIV